MVLGDVYDNLMHLNRETVPRWWNQQACSLMDLIAYLKKKKEYTNFVIRLVVKTCGQI